jgi:mannitol/fructose-specific phosphotransferase system IIA component (Ntr-type)
MRVMEISDLIQPSSVVAGLKATSKKQALQELAKHAAELTGASERRIFETLLERERLGKRLCYPERHVAVIQTTLWLVCAPRETYRF